MTTKHLLRNTISGLILILLIGIQGFAQTKKKQPVYYSVDANQALSSE